MSTDTTPNTTALRALAAAATPGPWHVDRPGCYVWGPCEEMVADRGAEGVEGAVTRARGVGGRLPIAANMAFIAAANPTAVLALLDETEQLQARAQGLEAALERSRELVAAAWKDAS